MQNTVILMNYTEREQPTDKRTLYGIFEDVVFSQFAISHPMYIVNALKPATKTQKAFRNDGIYLIFLESFRTISTHSLHFNVFGLFSLLFFLSFWLILVRM